MSSSFIQPVVAQRTLFMIVFYLIVQFPTSQAIFAQDCFIHSGPFFPDYSGNYDNFDYGTIVGINRDGQILAGNPQKPPFESGVIYHHYLDIDGILTTTALTPPADIVSSEFGATFDLNDSWVVAGAPDHLAPDGNEGAVIVYQFENGVPIQHTTLIPESIETRRFGTAVSIHRDEITVVSQLVQSDLTVSLQIEIYRWTPSAQWEKVQNLSIPDAIVVDCPTADPSFDIKVASHQHFLTVSMTRNYFVTSPPTNPEPCELGKVWVFEHALNSDWQFDTPIIAPGGSDPRTFGTAIDVDANQIIVGAPQTEGMGTAFVFEKSASGVWIETLLPFFNDTDGFGPHMLSNYGESVQINNRRAAVGYPLPPYTASNYVEGISLFERNSLGDWISASQLLGTNPGNGFGRGIALEGNQFAVTANSIGYGTDPLTLRFECGFPIQTYIRGDLNGDEKIDLADPVNLLFSISLGASTDCIEAADSDLNGILDLSDAIVLLTHLYLPESPPAYLDLGLCVEDLPAEALNCNSLNPCAP